VNIKTRAPSSDSTVVDPFHCDPTTTIAPPSELLISLAWKIYQSSKVSNIFSSYDSYSWISSTLMVSDISHDIDH
jgi:hypothetical protein